MSEPRVETIEPSELEDWERAAERAFHEDLRPEDLAMSARVLEADRALVVRESGQIVATTATLSRRLTLPGGAAVPAAAVTGVGVLPEHTRRGHMGRLLRRQLDDAREAGEALAILWASEGAIYGRYGFGISARAAHFKFKLDRAALRADLLLPPERVRVVEAAEALDDMRAVYEAVRADHPGMLDREGSWWDRRIYDPEHQRDGFGALRAVIQPGADGTPAGYALYAAKYGWDDFGANGELLVRELAAVSPEARAGLWRYLLNVDLMRTLEWRLAPDGDPLPLMLADANAMTQRVSHSLWVRLLDADRALAARAYAAPLDIVLDVRDPYCPWNEGAHRLVAGDGEVTCAPVDAPADLALDAAALGAAYLGGTPFETLAAAGQVQELRPGALRAAAAAFRSIPAPWCPEIF